MGYDEGVKKTLQIRNFNILTLFNTLNNKTFFIFYLQAISKNICKLELGLSLAKFVIVVQL